MFARSFFFSFRDQFVSLRQFTSVAPEMTCQSKMMSEFESRTVEKFFDKLAVVLMKYNETIRLTKTFIGRNCKQSYEDQRAQLNFYWDLSQVCGLRMAKVLSNHFFRGHGGKTGIDKDVIAISEDVYNTISSILPKPYHRGRRIKQ